MLPFADMNLGDAVEGPASAPGYAPAPQALINAAIAAEEAPTPEEKAVTNPLTNVLSAILTGRRLQQQPGPQLQPGPQQPGPQQQQPQPAAGTPAFCNARVAVFPCNVRALLTDPDTALEGAGRHA